MLDDIFLPYQKKWIQDDSRYAICEKSRRIGLTFAEAFRAVITRINKPEDYFFISKDEDSAISFIDYCKKFINILNLQVETPIADLKLAMKNSITMKNGSKIVGLTSNPTKARSNGGTVVIDELAFHENADKMFAAAFPLTTWGGGMRIISSHNGSGSFFNSLCRDAKAKGFSHHRVTIYDALRDGLAYKIPGDHHKYHPNLDKVNAAWLAGIKKPLSREIFDQEYCCMPLSAGSRVITDEMYDLIATVENVKDYLEPREYEPLYIGIDIGRTTDLTVVHVLERIVNDKEEDIELQTGYRTVCVKVIKGLDIPAQCREIEPLIRHKAVEQVAIDMGSIGRGVTDYFAGKYNNIIPVAFVPKFKTESAERVRTFAQQQRILLPANNPYRDDYTSLGFDGKSYDGRSAFGHSDHFWSLALALHAANQQGFSFFFA